VAVKRDANGRFAKGHSGNPNGRPRRTTEEEFLHKLRSNVTCEDFERMIEVAISRAKAGDIQFTKLLLQYLIGMPTQYIKQDIAGALQHVIVNWDDNTNDDD
jgi:hypothetical protein